MPPESIYLSFFFFLYYTVKPDLRHRKCSGFAPFSNTQTACCSVLRVYSNDVCVCVFCHSSVDGI